MDTYQLTPGLSLIDVAPAIVGFEKFIGTYLLKAGKVALFDVGPSLSIDNLVLGLQELNTDPADVDYIFTTHIHIDHAGGAGKAIRRMPKARVIVHTRGRRHLIDPTRLWEDSQRALGEQALQYQWIEPVPEDRLITAQDGMVFDLGGVEIEVLDTPGHAPHHMVFLEQGRNGLFVGDSAGTYIEEVDLLRPATPPPFNLEQTLISLDRLMRLHPASLYYTHFGQVTDALDKLYLCQQQLILWGKTIADCLEKNAGEEEMYQAVFREDAALSRINSLPDGQREREVSFLKSSISGFVGYFKRYGREYIKQLHYPN